MKRSSDYAVLNEAPVPKKVDSIYRNRLALFLQDGQYRQHSLPALYDHSRLHDVETVKLEVYSVPGTARPHFKDAIAAAEFRPAAKGETFGPSWTTHWFKIQIRVPQSWKKASGVHFNWDAGNEGFVFTEDGTPLVGLSGEERREWVVPAAWVKDGKWHTFYIETSCNAMFGNADPNDNIQPPTDDRHYTLRKADLVWPNAEARALRLDYMVIADCALNLPEHSWQKHRALEVANAIIDEFDESDVSSVTRGREIAAKFLGSNVDSADVFKDTSKPVVVTGLGHCHIDTAWLWPYAETRRKIGRSWSSQIDLIERYPEYNFVCSQAVQYQWLKEDYPQLFERLKTLVKAGRFIPIGGSWVESDTNMPSGEAIARQFLYGQRFFEDNFGARCHTFWLPDTFGYAAQIPQLCRGAGMEHFLTQKLSWNNINKFPNTTFNWVAPDGSQVLCHMPPADTYNSNCSVGELNLALSNNKNRGISETSLLLFGYGDGGGGPTVDMLEKMRRNRGVSDTVGELPRVQMHGDVQKYFESVLSNTNDGKDLVTWVGELYFEFHRGTYTSQANTKKNNRRSEVLLHDVELAATIASIVNPSYKYPKKDIDHMWEQLLLNQFHDVLPGSSIEMVYEDVDQIYAEVAQIGATAVESALVAAGLAIDKDGSSLVAYNSLPWPRAEVAEVPAGASASAVAHATQTSADGTKLAYFSDEVAWGALSPAAVPNPATIKEARKGEFVLDNGALRATIKDGLLVSLVDLKHDDREIIVPGEVGGQFVIFDDQPLNWQGWDTEVYSIAKVKNVAAGTTKIVESGPVRVSVEIEQQISEHSWIKTRVSLDAASSLAPSYLEYNSEVEWREACKFLKVEWPVDVREEFATYDSMYGSVKRPTHYNTSWDVAKFEVCCHKFADLSDYTYGVTVLNDSKYGFSVHGNVMRLSLLRAPKAPDGNADMGRHHIRYAIFGHEGRADASVVQAAQNFNHPLRVFAAKETGDLKAFQASSVRFDGPENVVVSAVKRGEDDFDVSTSAQISKRKSRSVVVRVYESLGGKSKGSLVTSLPVKKVFRANLLEDDQEPIEFKTEGGQVRVPVSLRAFEIATFRLEL